MAGGNELANGCAACQQGAKTNTIPQEARRNTHASLVVGELKKWVVIHADDVWAQTTTKETDNRQ
eukprot:SAG11_NODE_9294_length_925_cov_1.048426_2_plen_65_part_00